jgi:hypothetical protein
MRDFFLSILVFVLLIVFLVPEFLKIKEYEKINKCKGSIKSENYP